MADGRPTHLPAADDLSASAASAQASLVTHIAPRLASAVVVTVIGGFVALALIGLVTNASGPAEVALAVGCMLPIVGLQLGYFTRAGTQLRPPYSYLALAVQAAFVYLPVLQFGTLWLSFPGFLAGSVLIALPPRLAVFFAPAIVASIGVLQVKLGDPVVSQAYAASYAVIATTITALVVYGMTRLARLVHEVHTARRELSRIAVAQERLRLARDVHDLLGLSLSALTLKCELTCRLIDDHPERARAELTDMLAIARRALTDVRMVASGGRELSLPDEWNAARSVLAAADIEARLHRDGAALTGQVGSALATVLREGITNVLRHSKASWCEVTLRNADGTAVLDIVNDGVGDEPLDLAPPLMAGNGIGNLSHRVGMLGGELRAAPESPGHYRLRATIPVHAQVPDDA
ncbi:MAG TPA: histidine kinase [Pilimelia sp.]|nr:histidine kinase [Pilimelia sp.]